MFTGFNINTEKLVVFWRDIDQRIHSVIRWINSRDKSVQGFPGGTTQIYLKMDYRLKYKTIRHLEKIGENLWKLGLGKKLLFFTLKEQSTKENIDKSDLVKF